MRDSQYSDCPVRRYHCTGATTTNSVEVSVNSITAALEGNSEQTKPFQLKTLERYQSLPTPVVTPCRTLLILISVNFMQTSESDMAALFPIMLLFVGLL
ncbi:unnamed protein product [Mycena citricolor]|uniref:Uncharacterized protein n=1 Tax=Mycena citricolor TaxID=2018698 RepID=A0AAD2GYD3_9AGAR|nr:unnamed protein product [Mycena citricolor]